MRDEEWSELAVRRMAGHVTTFRRRGRAWVVVLVWLVGVALLALLTGGGR